MLSRSSVPAASAVIQDFFMFVVTVIVLRSPFTDLFSLIFDLADARAPVSADIIRELDEFKNILLKWHVSKRFV